MTRHHLKKEEALILWIDVQESLRKAIDKDNHLLDHVKILAKGADALGVPSIATTQYAKGLGPVHEELLEILPDVPVYDKITYSVLDDEAIREAMKQTGKTQIILAGMETHICVLSSALSLLEEGVQVFVPMEVVGSRKLAHHENGLAQIATAGGVVTNVETVLFQMMESAKSPAFKTIQGLIK